MCVFGKSKQTIKDERAEDASEPADLATPVPIDTAGGIGGLSASTTAAKEIVKPVEAKSAIYLKTKSKVRRKSALSALQIERT